jgi:ATP-dependent Clp protease ATP-binding subunit ClpA
MGQSDGQKEASALKEYTTDLTDLASQGKLDPVIGKRLMKNFLGINIKK